MVGNTAPNDIPTVFEVHMLDNAKVVFEFVNGMVVRFGC